MDYFKKYLGVTEKEFWELVEKKPSLKGYMKGYAAEIPLEKYLLSIPGVSKVKSPGDHDNSKRGDFLVTFYRQKFLIEAKSPDSGFNTRYDEEEQRWFSAAQVQCSGSRTTELPTGEEVKSSSCRRGQFDILAVNFFDFLGEWKFIFVRNSDLNGGSNVKGLEKLTVEQADYYFLAQSQPFTYPPQDPWYSDVEPLLKEMYTERTGLTVPEFTKKPSLIKRIFIRAKKKPLSRLRLPKDGAELSRKEHSQEESSKIPDRQSNTPSTQLQC
jgi:hypothetical protein